MKSALSSHAMQYFDKMERFEKACEQFIAITTITMPVVSLCEEEKENGFRFVCSVGVHNNNADKYPTLLLPPTNCEFSELRNILSLSLYIHKFRNNDYLKCKVENGGGESCHKYVPGLYLCILTCSLDSAQVT